MIPILKNKKGLVWRLGFYSNEHHITVATRKLSILAFCIITEQLVISKAWKSTAPTFDQLLALEANT